MKPLLDGDLLQYEVAFAAEASWKHRMKELGQEVLGPPPFDNVQEILENRIANILASVEATAEPTFCFTGKRNFRYGIAFTKPYKDRPSNKPFHHANIKAYLLGTRDCREVECLEADDLMSIYASEDPQRSIICTRDKDLRQVSGWHYSWELPNQPSFGPVYNDGYGWLKLSDKRDKVVGMGDKFFLCQMLTGDSVDTIPGIPKMGAVGAFEALQATTTYQEGLEAVKALYKRSYGLYWPEVMTEQGQLLWMVREMQEDQPVMWSFDYAGRENLCVCSDGV